MSVKNSFFEQCSQITKWLRDHDITCLQGLELPVRDSRIIKVSLILPGTIAEPEPKLFDANLNHLINWLASQRGLEAQPFFDLKAAFKPNCVDIWHHLLSKDRIEWEASE